MIAGTTFPPIMYGFACNVVLRTVILAVVTIASVLAFGLTLAPTRDSPTYRTIRGVLFFITGVFAALPIIIACYSTNSFWHWVIGHMIYAVGAFFYVTRIPERYWPGKFDYYVVLIIIIRVKVITCFILLSLLQLLCIF